MSMGRSGAAMPAWLSAAVRGQEQQPIRLIRCLLRSPALHFGMHILYNKLLAVCVWCLTMFGTDRVSIYELYDGQRNRETTPSSAVAWASTHGPAVVQAADARPHTHKPSHQ